MSVRGFHFDEPARSIDCAVAIIGGGMGGIAAALRCLEEGVTVCLTEETDWIGGQATAQGVSALDENKYVETSGAPLSYQRWRQSIRDHYREKGLAGPFDYGPTPNPGNCWVSWLAFEPHVGLRELTELLRPFIESNQLTVLVRHKAVSVTRSDRLLTSVCAVDLDTGHSTKINASIFIDATELGDLLPLSGIPYRSGAESHFETGELHAPDRADSQNVQDYTYPFVLEFLQGEDHTIAEPPEFADFERSGKFTFNGFAMFSCAKNERQEELLPFWHYRRLIDAQRFPPGCYERDLSMINWDSNDLREQNIIDQAPNAVADRLALAKSLSLSFLYWLQTRAPRDDGGTGYPELRLRTDVLGTTDGFSKYPYIRESRRIIAREIITEQDVAAATNAGARARLYADSIGIGLYPIDIHGRQDVPGAAQQSKPFQIPLGALLPQEEINVIAGAKNIGTTHITNGCYRLHPVEWAIGEAAGLTAALCVNFGYSPAQIRDKPEFLLHLQKGLVNLGSPIFWFDDVPTNHPQFYAIQIAAVMGLIPIDDDNLHFHPDGIVGPDELQRIIDTRMAHASYAPQTPVTRSALAEWLVRNAS
jgi:hypothetical protein